MAGKRAMKPAGQFSRNYWYVSIYITVRMNAENQGSPASPELEQRNGMVGELFFGVFDHLLQLAAQFAQFFGFERAFGLFQNVDGFGEGIGQHCRTRTIQ